VHYTRRQWIIQGSALALGTSMSFSYQANPVSPLKDGPETERFRNAQKRALAKYQVEAESRFLNLKSPAMKVHVLVAGRGDPVILIHGGGAEAVQLAPLMSGLTGTLQCFAPDRPGCGLTDRFDYANIPFRQHGIDFVTSLLDALHLSKAAIAGNSMGGYWALLFALAEPDRVTKLALLGGAAGSTPPPVPRRPPRGEPSLETTRAAYRVLMASPDRVPGEIVDADFAASALPGARQAWNSMLEDVAREGGNRNGLAYALRPELRNLKPPTLFIYGDKDLEGPPSLAYEMAELAPKGRCEIVQDAGHLVWLDQPRVCTKLLLDFLKSA
jgi:pimeloyl-ACP methyl ester carboxylesterase